MKNLALLFFFSLLSTYGLKAQVMHSSDAMEYSLGAEGFSQYIASTFDFTSSGILEEELYRIRPVVTGRYKKFKETGNYLALGMSLGRSTWGEEVMDNSLGVFIPIAEPSLLSAFEINQETNVGFSYHYSFLINKEKMSNLQFFIGAGADLYSNFASKTQPDFLFGFNSRLRRTIIGGRISAIPELLYLIPNSRMTISLRTLIPILDAQRLSEDTRQFNVNSFTPSFILSNNFDILSIGRSRIELGFGYFLRSR